MKLIRFGEAGKEKPGVISISKCYDVSAWITDYDEAFFENDGLKKLEKIVATTTLPVVDVKRYGCPVKRPAMPWSMWPVIVCIMISANVNFSSNVVVPGIKEKAAIHLHQSDHGWLQKMKLLMFTTCVYGLP